MTLKNNIYELIKNTDNEQLLVTDIKYQLYYYKIKMFIHLQLLSSTIRADGGWRLLSGETHHYLTVFCVQILPASSGYQSWLLSQACILQPKSVYLLQNKSDLCTLRWEQGSPAQVYIYRTSGKYQSLKFNLGWMASSAGFGQWTNKYY